MSSPSAGEHDRLSTTFLTASPTSCSALCCRAHGVRIQPEWDMPGHGAWGLGKPELMTSACSDALDVTRPELYDFMREFLGEMGDIFTEDYLVRSKLRAGADSVSLATADSALVVASSSAATSFRSHASVRNSD